MTLSFGSVASFRFSKKAKDKKKSTPSENMPNDLNGNPGGPVPPLRSNEYCNVERSHYINVTAPQYMNVAGSWNTLPRAQSSSSRHSNSSWGVTVDRESDQIQFATDKPHLVSLVSGRHSNSVTLHPINKGRTTLGSGGMGSVPDIVVIGTGIEPEHCVLEFANNMVTLTPLATLVSIDGLRITRGTKLSQGCMICFGRSNYFRFNQPSPKESILPSTGMSPVSFYPAVDNPEYFHMTAQTALPSSASAQASRDQSYVTKSSATQHHFHSVQNGVDGSSDESDSAPEVPPRSEAPSQVYHNTPSVTATTEFLGDYIYTKAPEDSTSKTPPAPLTTAGVATVIDRNGGTSFHNTLYCSDLPPFCNPNLRRPPTYSKTSPLPSPPAPEEPIFSFPQVPAPPPPTSPPIIPPSNGVPHQSPVSAKGPSPPRSLFLGQAHLNQQKAKEAREREAAEAQAEDQRLEEILTMCAEYERQTSAESVKGTSPHHTLTQNRIKTNGSLPREKRSPTRYTGSPLPLMGVNSPASPTSPQQRGPTPSQEELTSIFNYQPNSPTNRSNNGYCSVTSQGVVSPGPVVATRSPYENISSQYHHYQPPPSPRTRIRTIAAKDPRETSPESDCKMSDFGTFGKISLESSLYGSLQRKQPVQASSDSPARPPRSPRMQRSFLNESGTSTASITNKYFGQSGSPLNNASLYSSPSSSPAQDCPVKNRVFQQQMMKNLQDTLNVENVNEEICRLKEEKQVAMNDSAHTKLLLDDIERQQNELLRELEMERALLEGELAATKHQLAMDEETAATLQSRSQEMDARHLAQRNADFDCLQCLRTRLEEAEESLEGLEWQHRNFEGSTDEETQMLETLKSKHETVESERKCFEDTEFAQMESQAYRESEREELNKEINELTSKVEKGRASVAELESQVAAMTASVCQETEDLQKQKNQLLAKIQKSCAPELAERLAKLHLLDRSQEDLDLINQVSECSPLGYNDACVGRKASSTLQQIERNRHLDLATKGTSVIDEERKRVEELKQRVASEVKAQWNVRKDAEQRQTNCASLNSVGSEESSLTSSDVPVESLSSEDTTVHSSAIPNTKQIHLRQRETEATSDDSFRPISDASSFCDSDGAIVRLRTDKSRTQRPLTQYLPVRAEAPFDLRQHIESAGHQLEQCGHLTVTSGACRGYLCKLGSKLRTWNKRWFVFDRTKRAFVYYTDKNENKVRGGAYFKDIAEVYVDHQHSIKSPKANVTFCVKTNERVYHLMAPSPEAMRIWIDVVFTGAEGYRQFQSGS